MDKLSTLSTLSTSSFVNDNKKVLMSVDRGVKGVDSIGVVGVDSVANVDGVDGLRVKASQILINKNLRKQDKNEIIIDVDDRTEQGVRCLSATGILLVEAGYHLELWYAEGMKEPHIHLKNIPHIDALPLEQGKKYRRLFYEKYIPREFWRAEKINDNEGEIPDFSLCNPYQDAYHPISEENKPHYKYGTILKLVSEFNSDKANFCEKELYNVAIAGQQAERKFEANPNTLSGKIASKISIFLIADKFGITPSGEKLRQCPFHNDNNPSLSLDEARGLFHCFGCQASGNIIKFYAMLKKLNPRFTMRGSQ